MQGIDIAQDPSSLVKVSPKLPHDCSIGRSSINTVATDTQLRPNSPNSRRRSFNVIPPAAAEPRFAVAAEPEPMLTFVRHDIEPEDAMASTPRDIAGGHGRFAAPGNAVRRQIQVKAINPRTSDEMAGFFRDVSYTLTGVRQGEAVPPIKVERVPDDIGNKDGRSGSGPRERVPLRALRGRRSFSTS